MTSYIMSELHYTSTRIWFQGNTNKSIIKTTSPYLRFLRGTEEAGARTG